MKINSVTFQDNSRSVTIDKIYFNNLTLLVGASGVGKTQILQSLGTLQMIAGGRPISGAEWEIDFNDNNGDQFIWSGKYSINESLENDIEYLIGYKSEVDIFDEQKPNIEKEVLKKNNKVIVNRDSKDIIFNDVKTVKLDKKISVLKLLSEEDEISVISNAFKKIRLLDNGVQGSRMNLNYVWNVNYSEAKEEFSTLEKIKSSNQNGIAKLFYAYHNKLSEFDKVRESFIEVFPQVEDVRFKKIEDKGFFGDSPLLIIKEKGVEKDIDITRMSSGMLKTLLHISDLLLADEGTVFLIDEFENSLGVNCIDEITDYILNSGDGLQFIITSHHPYIINNINSKYWKVIVRLGGNINAYNSEDLKIGESRHDSFIQLLNTDAYTTGSI